MEQTITKIKPDEVLTWTQCVYYAAGALVGFVVAYIKIRSMIRRKRKADNDRRTKNKDS
jgi:hypothetical protein